MKGSDVGGAGTSCGSRPYASPVCDADRWFWQVSRQELSADIPTLGPISPHRFSEMVWQ